MVEQSADTDYKAKYDDLYQKVKHANGVKKVSCTKISNDITKLLKIICDPDPPGCSGPIPSSGSYEDLSRSVQKANAEKQKLLTTISSDIEVLLQTICDPDPPGCGT